jgi:hypothetical protein
VQNFLTVLSHRYLKLTAQCIDTMTKLDACGGCPQAGGMDCSELPGIAEVACVAGACKSEFKHPVLRDIQLTRSLPMCSGSLLVEFRGDVYGEGASRETISEKGIAQTDFGTLMDNFCLDNFFTSLSFGISALWTLMWQRDTTSFEFMHPLCTSH